MRLRIREEHRAMPAYEKPPAWRVDVYYCRNKAKVSQILSSLNLPSGNLGRGTILERIIFLGEYISSKYAHFYFIFNRNGGGSPRKDYPS